MWVKLKNPPPRYPFEYILNLEANPHSLLSFPWTLAPQIICDKILFSHTRRWYEFLFLYFFLFRFFVILRYYYKNYFIIIIIIIIYLFSWKLLLFSYVWGCSGMFRNVPASSGMFHVRNFIDALSGKFMYLIQCIRFGSWKVRRLNRALGKALTSNTL